MLGKPTQFGSSGTTKARDVSFIVIAVLMLVLKRYYSGPLEEVVYSYAGNFVVSFAVYFIMKQLPLFSKPKSILTACLALVPVEMFEVFDGFGIMTNVYDPIDLLANALGIVFALVIDTSLRTRQQAATNA